ncbi:PREDICTED: solute carrier family 2, facilitated glucose transporter member 8-like [Amphimedon queenslandica]|uniref:Major facilitator superfamily (MFS) profile domain-containing protein n=1 Tax=Amphimedon queenslandica TaxID=400682 RepID=A0A1X7V805_AMPQE|nr:PREDICTED: solute carrier family 2, facilitated glucose transporter member 8-like [Amphimedon queenslandica]|eukprot:XP_003385376.1 PREDICTED: solute carrier family 2, facilitated glucose transporter member 8-like [Amphimedon queenslandica]
MSSERSPINRNGDIRYSTIPDNSIQSSTQEDKSKNVNPLVALYREISSGEQRLRIVFLYSCIAALGAVLTGFALGYSSLAQLDLSSNVGTMAVPSDKNFKYIGSIINVGALIGATFTGVASDKFGRTALLMVGSIPCVIGWAVIAGSWYFIRDDNSTPVLVMLLVGRFLTGLAAGCYSLVVPVYILEISPASLKGLFGALNQLGVTLGILIIYLLTSFCRYYYGALVAAGLSLVFVVVVLFLPETPRWLMANNERLEANRILCKLRGPRANIQKEMSTLDKGLERDAELSLVDKLKMLRYKYSYIPLIFAVFLMFFQQFCGINVIIFYAGTVLKTAKVQDANLAADFGVGVIQVIFTFVSVVLIDMLGRKILLCTGGLLLSLSAIGLGVYYYLTAHHTNLDDSNKFSYLAVVCLAVFIIGFSIGWGPIPWVMMGELTPLQTRGILSGITTAVNWTFSTIVTFAFQPYEDLVNPYGAWWTFGAISALSIPFVFFLIPETRGKELEDIQEEFEKRYGRNTRNNDDKE